MTLSLTPEVMNVAATKFWHLTFDDVHYSTQAIATKLPFYPDYIVAIARGGLVPASLLWRYFPTSKFRVVKARSYTGIFKQQRVRVSAFDWKELKGHKVLFVDDIYDTGKTWEGLQKKIPKGVSFSLATVVTKQPDHTSRVHAQSCSPDVWCVFPWEKEKI